MLYISNMHTSAIDEMRMSQDWGPKSHFQELRGLLNFETQPEKGSVYAALISSCFRRPASRARQRVLCAGQEVMQPKKAGRSYWYHSWKIQTMIRCVETYPMACQWSPWTIWGSPYQFTRSKQWLQRLWFFCSLVVPWKAFVLKAFGNQCGKRAVRWGEPALNNISLAPF